MASLYIAEYAQLIQQQGEAQQMPLGPPLAEQKAGHWWRVHAISGFQRGHAAGAPSHRRNLFGCLRRSSGRRSDKRTPGRRSN